MAMRSNDKPITDEDITVPGVHILTREEAWQIFDEQAREWLGLSGQEFLDAYDRGEFDDRAEDDRVYPMLMILPLAR